MSPTSTNPDELMVSMMSKAARIWTVCMMMWCVLGALGCVWVAMS